VLALRLLGLAPPAMRPGLVRALSPRQRRWLIQYLARHGAGRGGGTAAVLATTSPVQARRHNLNEVMATLDAAGVPYFRVPHAPEQRTRLAVPTGHRDATLAALGSPRLARAQVRGWTASTRPRCVPVRDAAVVTVYWPVTNADRSMLLGEEVACDIELWTEDGDALVSPRQPPVTPLVRRDSPMYLAADRDFDQFSAAGDDGVRFPTRRELMLAGMDWVRFPVDAVYTWVDGEDPRWQQRQAAALEANGWAGGRPQTTNAPRFICHDELRYSLRSLHYFAPWVRRIFLVTDAQVPDWLDTSHPQVTVVDHREIFGDTGRLPTFNSHAIESRLHHIPGLAEHFLYLNDDVFFGRPQTPDQYFLPNGIAWFFPSSMPVDAGSPGSEDPPVMCAGKNNREVVARQFGRLLTQKIKHTPHSLRRSVLAEIERGCPELVRATSGHQFRHPADISIPSSLHHYWSYLTGRSVPGDIRYTYTDLDDPRTPLLLANLLWRRHQDVFCLNFTEAADHSLSDVAAMLADFLPRYFPFPSPYELPDAPALLADVAVAPQQTRPELPAAVAPADVPVR